MAYSATAGLHARAVRLLRRTRARRLRERAVLALVAELDAEVVRLHRENQQLRRGTAPDLRPTANAAQLRRLLGRPKNSTTVLRWLALFEADGGSVLRDGTRVVVVVADFLCWLARRPRKTRQRRAAIRRAA
jgi:hypothetical protein